MSDKGHLTAWIMREFGDTERGFDAFWLVSDYVRDYPDMAARQDYWTMLALAERRAA